MLKFEIILYLLKGFYDRKLNIKRLQKIIGNERFMLTYGDGLSNINISELIAFHGLQYHPNNQIALVYHKYF